MSLDLARVKAVVFDMDDTLLDWRGAEAKAIDRLAALHFAAHGIGVERVRATYAEVMAANYASWKKDRVWWYIQDRLRMLNDRLGTPQLSVDDLTATFSRESTLRLAWLEGAEAALAAAREGGRKTALLTNGRPEVQRPKVHAFGLHTAVDFVGITGELGAWKPDLAAFQAVLDKVGVAASHALMVGDNEDFDITPAKQLGMQTAWVDARRRSHADADVVVANPGELAPLLRQAPTARPPGI